MTILKVIVIAATGLKHAHCISKMKPFTVVSFAGVLPDRRIKTPTNKGCNPVWGCCLNLEIPDAALQQNSLTVVFEIFSKNKLARHREVGKAFVSVSELLATSSRNGMARITKTVPVFTPAGDIHGELKFSYEFNQTDASEETIENVGNARPTTEEINGGGGGLSVKDILGRVCGTVAAVILSDAIPI